MRELKFRVWNGMEMIYDVTVGRFGVFYVNPGDKGNGLDSNDSASLTPFTTKYPDDTPVMQYTGLKDKNGKEIWEGDIVDDGQEQNNHTLRGRHKVSIEDGGMSPFSINGWEGTMSSGDVEVIGNIYENPNLITDNE